MARFTIDYGIDLGTTNSAIARMENGKPVIKKTNTQKDTLPSCVSVQKNKTIYVGDQAYGQLEKEFQLALKNSDYKLNTFSEFKRTMGTETKYHSPFLNKDFSSEELSAEVLKKLKSFITEDNFKSVVITVPARFDAIKKNATVNAAKFAGFNQVELIQEPYAASLAYGLNISQKDAFWLVFDFGGGTFDAVLMKMEDSTPTVIDSGGDNQLGGKDIDLAIIDNILIPHIKENFSISNILEDPLKRELFRNSWKHKVEEAKISLSFNSEAPLMTQLFEDFGNDEEGNKIEIDINLTSEDMENITAPIFQKAIDICKDILKRNNLEGKQLGSLILIGGPTYSPILRKMLKEQITTKVDTKLDPMTAVAQGAALFASTISVSDEIIDDVRDKQKVQIKVDSVPTSVQTTEWVNLKILKDKSEGKIPAKVFAELIRYDKAWQSGKNQLTDKPIVIEVLLNEQTSNVFNIILTDDKGNNIPCEPSQFSILQGIDIDGRSNLPLNIGIEIYDRLLNEDVFTPVKGLEKNNRIPATGVINGLKTQKQIVPGKSSDFIVVPIYQGDYYAEGTRAIYNDHITDVKISGERLPALLPEGSEVNITIKVDRSEQMIFIAEFPFLNHSEEINVTLINKPVPSPDFLTNEITKAKKKSSQYKANEISEKLIQIENDLENEKGSDEGKIKTLNNIREQLRSLDKVQSEAEWPRLVKELKEEFFRLKDLITEIKSKGEGTGLKIDRIELEIDEYEKNINHFLKEKTSENIKELKELIDKIASTKIILLIYLVPHDFIKIFHNQFNDIKWRNSSKVRSLLNNGLSIIANNYNRAALSDIVFSVYEEMLDPSQLDFSKLRK